MVPNGWRDLYLNEFAKIIVSPVDKKSFESETPVELCNYTDVYYNDRITQSISFMEATAKKSEIEKYTLELDDVIITKDSETPGDIAVPALVAEDLNGVVCGYHLAIVRTNKKHAIGSFINYLFSMPKTRYYFFTLATGATRFGLSIRGINKAHFQLPPLPEQRKIAKILSTWDKAISTTERLIDNSKQQKQALMQQLLTGKKRLLDDLGKPFEGEWEEVKLGDLSSKVTKGTTPSTNGFSFQQDGINFVKVESISSSGRFDRSKFAYIDNDCYESFKRSQLEKDDILFSIAGALGRTALVDETILPANTNQALAIVRLNRSRTVHRYIIYYLNSPRIASVIKGLTAKAAQPNLSLKDVNGLTILLPSLEEQEKISTALFNADKEIELLEKQLADLKQEKKALMQQLLTGKRRVKVDDEAAA